MVELNLTKLEKEFNITTVEEESSSSSLESIKDNIEGIISSIKIDKDPDKILLSNIERANYLLDLANEQLTTGNFTVGILEASSQLVDSITKAVSEIRSSQQQELYLRLRDEMLQLKKVEAILKAKKTLGYREDNRDKGRDREIIVTDRETIIKMIEKGKGVTNAE